jgi:hypothetical protein
VLTGHVHLPDTLAFQFEYLYLLVPECLAESLLVRHVVAVLLEVLAPVQDLPHVVTTMRPNHTSRS